MKRKIFNFFVIISIILILTPISAILAQEFGDDAPATGFRSILSHSGEQGVSLRVCLDTGCCNLCDVFTVASNIFKFLRNSIAFPIAVLMIIYGGVMMIFSGGSTKRVANGKKAMSSALVGFAIVWGVGLILNTALTIITKSPISYKAFIDGDLSAVKWSCEKDCGSGTTNTGKGEPTLGKDDIPGVSWDKRVSTSGVSNCIMNAIKDLAEKYPNKITVTSLNDRDHSANSYHYDGKAGDLWTNNKKEWDEIANHLKSQGFTAFCDAPEQKNGKTVYVSVPCSGPRSTHIHFDMRNMLGKTCP
jgi:type IV secretory pathway VirB2 component (pilin)